MEKKLPYLDPNLGIEERVSDLLKRMTLKEKLDQLYSTGVDKLPELLERAEKGEKVDISASFVYQEFDPEVYDRLQEYQLKNNRLKIPFILASENTHGVSNPLCTIFPSGGCMAATFDPDLIGKVAAASAKEARILGITQIYAPNIDITWEQRWGRAEENFGEDPYLTSRMGVEVVKNTQRQGVCATLKHYIAYGLGESGINLTPAHIGRHDIREYMLPPFKECIKKGGAWALMPAYIETDGVPIHADGYWMQDVLRGELGFDGMVVTDYGASNMLVGFHHSHKTPLSAGITMCDNRVDMEADSFFGYNADFLELLKSGKYPMKKFNECVKDVLRLKFRLGLFENPFSKRKNIKEVHCKKHVAIARKVAEEGIVLLKNDGVLPLDKKKKVLLTGPNAAISQLGDYVYYGFFNPDYKGTCVAEESLSLKEVLENSGISCAYERGCEFNYTTEEMLEAAYKAGLKSDVIILAMGNNSKGGKNAGAQGADGGEESELAVTSGEGYDLTSIELTPPQIKLFDKMAETGKPVILLIYGGRPVAIKNQVSRCSAILFAAAAGEQGNEAMTDILYGKVNPGGKLPISFPQSTGHLPCFYNYKPSARGRLYRKPGSYEHPGRDYVFDTPDPLFPFGFGLSYTEFEYSGLKVEKKGKKYLASVDVKNIGKYEGNETVLLFLSCECHRVTPVIKKLRKFKRVFLKPGETKTVEFLLSNEDFTSEDIDYAYRAVKGGYKATVGNLTAEFTVD